ncbi:MAG TPA: tripartite tricarboxylate transporter substrate binding protein [Alphaproteobacteria bacterium]|nr:tripartite tricarboxylate transporter substrate binding protein [Alphaproteobacteria bacterium]
MHLKFRDWLVRGTVVATLTVAAALSPAAAQTYPARPIRIIVPAAASGVSDVVARLTADYLGRSFNQTVIVEDRPGAGGNVGADVTAKAPPDGYNLCMITVGNVAINPFIYKDMPFDALKDLAPVAPVAELVQVVVINFSLPVHSLKELIAYAKERPGKLNYGSAGVGTTTQLAAELFAQMGGIQLVHVPYRGAAPAVQDTAAGQVQMTFVGLGSAQPLLATGKIRILAAASKTRMAADPDLPTAAESGLPGYEFSTWLGLVTSRGTPAQVIATLNKAVETMVADPAIQKRLVDGGLEPMKATPAQFEARIQADYKKFGALVKVAGLKPE